VSVRPSITLVYCIQTAEDIIKLLSRPSRPIIPVFDALCRYQIPGALNTWGAKNLRFSTETAVYLRNVREARGHFFRRILITLVPFDLERPNSAGEHT